MENIRFVNDKVKKGDLGENISFKNKSSYAALNDEKLWQLFKEGDEGAFVLIYQQYIDCLFNYGLQYTSDKERIKDCIQDFFVYLREKRDTIGKTNAIKPYLLKSFRRRLLINIKKLAKIKAYQEKYSSDVIFQVELSFETLLIEKQFSDSQITSLNKALKTLSDKEKEAIYLFYFEDLSYLEIAKIQDYDHVSSARRLIYRALQNLRLVMKVYILLALSSTNY